MNTSIKRLSPHIILLFFIMLISLSLQGVWKDSFPGTLTQADGTELEVYFSGDEHHNWIHDKDMYTMIHDPETGMFCWAVAVDGDLVSTGYPVHLHTPQSLHLKPRENISEQRYLEKRERIDRPLREDSVRAPTTGTINQLVIYIRFSDQTAFPGTIASQNALFNNTGPNVNSLKQYFIDASYNQLTVNSHFFPTPTGTTILSYQSPHPRNFFRPYSSSNQTGYQGEAQANQRLHDLLRAAVQHIASQVPTSLVIDSNNNGRVDNVCFVIRGAPDAWADLLWPHRWALFTNPAVFINGKRVWDYNFNLETSMASSGVGVLAHEFAHTLGAPDLYRYYTSNIDPIGGWDLMASDRNPPQSIGSFIKSKYFNWMTIPTVTATGTQTLSPLATHRNGSAIRINSPNSSTQYFIAEYRHRPSAGTDANLPGAGLLIYRVNASTTDGNQDPPDELYLYRPGGTTTANGTLNSAFFNSTVGRTQINDSTNPSSFLANGSAGGLNISGIGAAGATISFTVTLPGGGNPPPTNLSANMSGTSVALSWTAPSATGVTGYRVFRNSTFLANVTGATNTSYTDSAVTIGTAYAYHVTAMYGSNESGASNTANITVSDGSEITIGSGTSNLNLPIFPWYDFTYTQQIYLSSQIGRGGTITHISFFYNGATSLVNSAHWKIWLGHTSLLSFAGTASSNWVDIDTQSLVYDATIPSIAATAGWITIPLTTPFLYNGAGNLLITVSERSTGNSGQSSFFHSTPTTGNFRSLMARRDGTGPYPDQMRGAIAATERVAGQANLRIAFVSGSNDPAVIRPTVTNPYVQSFSAIPTETGASSDVFNFWSRFSGSFVSGVAALTPAPSTQGWINHEQWAVKPFSNMSTHTLGNAAVVNLWGTYNHWLVTPQIDIPAGHNLTLNFKYAKTAWGDNISPSPAGATKRFMVVVSPNNGVTWHESNVVARWDNTGNAGTLSFDQVPHATSATSFAESTICLAAYSGSIRIAFYGISTTNQPDIDFFIDDVTLSVASTDTNDEEMSIISKTELLGNYPNPFNPETTIEFSVAPTKSGIKEAGAKHVNIDVYNVKGQKIRTIVDGYYSAGKYSAVWNGKDDAGREVSSGIYFYQMRTQDMTTTRKMVLMK
jgi:M6 family metalloprotease-like protein